MQPAILALEDGTVFYGQAIGAVSGTEYFTIGEVVFNTALTGYQEILTDPSYANQLITLTNPHIGNTGINSEDSESNQIYAKGLIIRQLPILTSSWRKQQTLNNFLIEQKILGIQNIDTRKLTRHLRDKGSLKGCILTDGVIDQAAISKAQQLAKNHPSMTGADLAQEVSTQNAYVWSGGGSWRSREMDAVSPSDLHFHVVAYDFGIKKSILRLFTDFGMKVTVVPAKTPISKVLSYQPDGVFLSNGPGDPEPCQYAIQNIQKLLDRQVPLFGICLGFQLLALALGAKTYKMKFGHHGGNHPVQNLEGKVLISAQNHGFAVDENSLPASVCITHRSLFDKSIQGLAHKTLPAFGFQGHPEAGPGPADLNSLFEQFKLLMAKHKIKPKTNPTALEIN